jgi:hypothetical protein
MPATAIWSPYRWLVLIYLPRWGWSAGFVAPVLVPAFMALLYCILIATQFGRGQGGFSSLASVGCCFRIGHCCLLAGCVTLPSIYSWEAGRYETPSRSESHTAWSSPASH